MSTILAALHPGASYHCETLEGERYRGYFDKLIVPEELTSACLANVRTLLVPCRTNPDRLLPRMPVLMDFLARGGTLVAMGETFQDIWLPDVTFTPVETNYWWWLEPGASLGVSLERPDHPLLRGLSSKDAAWHLHGWYVPAPGSEVLITDGSNQPIMYVDEKSYAGRLVVTSLDPCYHHGCHFMPTTTLFLDGFLPNLRRWSGG